MAGASLLDQERLSIAAAAKRIGVHVSTVWRWTLRGIDGRKLPTVKIGGRRQVIVADLERFIAAGAGSESSASPTRTGAEAAGRELERMGV